MTYYGGDSCDQWRLSAVMGVLSEPTISSNMGELKEFVHLHALCMDIWYGSFRAQERYDLYLKQCSDTQRIAESFFKEAVQSANASMPSEYWMDSSEHWLEQMLDNMRHLILAITTLELPLPNVPCADKDPLSGKTHSWKPRACSRCSQFKCGCEHWLPKGRTGSFDITDPTSDTPS